MGKTALLSVCHKEGITDFARQLQNMGWRIFASAGTAKALKEADIAARDVAELVGGGPILGHRVVTLSREIHAGLLATNSLDDLIELDSLGVPYIELVCVDLYPLKAEIERAGSTPQSVLEKTDIGGPALLRSAAKGRRIVICDPADRPRVTDWLKAGRPQEEEFLTVLAAKAEFVVSEYCQASARFHGKGRYAGFQGCRALECRYGENAWQTPAALFGTGRRDPLALDKFTLTAGAPPSYNNFCDVNRLLQTITHLAAVFDVNRGEMPLIAVGVKHGNACGAAIGKDPLQVLRQMIDGDRRALLGGLVMTNFPLDESAAETLLTYNIPAGQRRLLDGIIAPAFSEKSVEMLKRKGDKCRFLANTALDHLNRESLDTAPLFKAVRGGFLLQPNYTFVLNLMDPRLEKLGPADTAQEIDLLIAWAIGSTSNSNTITLVKNSKLIGNGVGQQDRVICCELAVKRARDAGHDTAGAVAYSDSFFPFADGPKVLADAGIKAILASSGSIRDEEVKQFCQEHDVTLFLIPDAVGRGFFGH